MKVKQITTILLNWNRPENLDKVIKSVRMQSIDSEVWLWDNSGKFEITGNCDRIYKSSYNQSCQARYALCNYVTTPYVFTMDDDRYIEDPNLFNKLLNMSYEFPDDVLCYYGKSFQDIDDEHQDVLYSADTCQPGWVFHRNWKVQMGATGCCFFPTRLINNIPRNVYVTDEMTEKDMKYGDDMWFSKFQKMRVATCISRGIVKMDDKGEGLCHDPDHYGIRNKLCREWWGK